MSRSFLILHGIENHRPPGHWHHWLAGRLRERGERVLYPQMPDADSPSLQAWRRELDRQLADMGEGERVVVCHSLSCLLWLGHAAAVAAAGPVDRVALVAPPAAAQLPPAGRGFSVGQLDARAVAGASRATPLVVCGDADPYNPGGAGDMYARPLGLDLVVIKGAGHIVPEEGYGPWPAIETWCETAVFPDDAASSHGAS
jgi:predicted alpha/beta hydrolase family esterase